MRAVTVTAWGNTPTFTNSATAPAEPTEGTTQIRILASGLPNFVRSLASGTHYSVRDAPLPYTPGVDGVGYTATDNKLVYFQALTNKPNAGGAFAESINLANNTITPVPLPAGADSNNEAQKREAAIKVASLINPAMSSWMALKTRARVDELQQSGEKFNVLILGVTSASGRLATLVARHLGASEIIGVARDAEAVAKLQAAGRIDHAITLNTENPKKTDYSLLNKVRVHIALDYIYGSHALALLSALPSSPSKADDLEVRYVHIGTLGREPDIAIPGPLLRSKNIMLSGAGPGSWSVKALTRETEGMVKAIVELANSEGWKEEYGVVERRLEDVEEAWNDMKSRTVFVMDL
ncbi:hypothetical protein H2198_003822 [Neophaeococcomyces mojaviensis]|uniref:Uncharacterized protein n=1 Tax=Neophaeococcomyces mojaviensis TaxID=3383035 RepID=A0ACC3AAB0_9EURO|nr:hypothetical protein H2198_003822 [Knufia sp. JES_112]